jgi:hypothetical protein
MDVGSKFDAWIAEHVMKWQIVQIYSSENIIAFQADDGKRKYTGVDLDDPWKWSPTIDIADAWQVVEKLRADGWQYELVSQHYSRQCVVIFGRGTYDVHNDEWSEYCTDCSLSVPYAICLAAKKAIETKKG